MKCTAENCTKDAIYKTAGLCQKHYFRVRRAGVCAPEKERKERRFITPNGYVRVCQPTHPLADKQGYVFEHRAVAWDARNGVCGSCELCEKPEAWETCHVDHCDDDRQNNDPGNVRVLCRGCNVMRGHTATSMGSTLLTVNGITLPPNAWVRQPGVCVSGTTIRRRKRLGATDEEAIFGEKMTHRNKDAKKSFARCDDLRGINA